MLQGEVYQRREKLPEGKLIATLQRRQSCWRRQQQGLPRHRRWQRRYCCHVSLVTATKGRHDAGWQAMDMAALGDPSGHCAGRGGA